MIKLFLSPQAINDLENIFQYTIQKWSFKKAEIYQDLLIESMNVLLKNPNDGKKYFYRKGKYRKFNAGKHILFYKVENKKYIVIRILHQIMDLQSHII